MKLRSAFNKLKPYFGKENMHGIYAVLLMLHLLLYTITSFDQSYQVNTYEFGTGLLTDLFTHTDEMIFKIILTCFFAGALFAFFLLIKKILGKTESNDDSHFSTRLLCCVFCIFPVFITARMSSYSYSVLVHLIIILFTSLGIFLLLEGKRKKRFYLLLICAVCEFFYAGFIFTYFPVFLLILVYKNKFESSVSYPVKKKAEEKNKKATGYMKIKNDYFPVYLSIIVVLLFVLLLVLTPILNRNLRHFLSPIFDTNDQNIFFDSVNIARRGTWTSEITAIFLNYTVAALPFLIFCSCIWIKAYRMTKKKQAEFSAFFLMCLFAELPALAGIIFFRSVGLWMMNVVFSQAMLILVLIYKNNKTIIEILNQIYKHLTQRKAYIFILFLFMFALACFFYEMKAIDIVGRTNL